MLKLNRWSEAESLFLFAWIRMILDYKAFEGILSLGRMPYFDIHHSVFDIRY